MVARLVFITSVLIAVAVFAWPRSVAAGHPMPVPPVVKVIPVVKPVVVVPTVVAPPVVTPPAAVAPAPVAPVPSQPVAPSGGGGPTTSSTPIGHTIAYIVALVGVYFIVCSVEQERNAKGWFAENCWYPKAPKEFVPVADGVTYSLSP